jgi:hypothetical protein
LQFPNPPWPQKPPKTTPGTLPDSSPVQSISGSYRSLGGLSWPEEGYPGFLCVVIEKPVDISSSFDIPIPNIEIVYESPFQSFTDLAKLLSVLANFRCATIYVDISRDNFTFLRDFNAHKKQNGIKVSLKSTNSSGFEPSLMQIRDIIASKHITFPVNSIIRSQLSTFSRNDVLHPMRFYAIRALCMVIGRFKAKPSPTAVESVPNLRSWY